MTQHALDIIIKEYQQKFFSEGRTLLHIHIWSDGCAGQVISFIGVASVKTFAHHLATCYLFYWVPVLLGGQRPPHLRRSHRPPLLSELPREGPVRLGGRSGQDCSSQRGVIATHLCEMRSPLRNLNPYFYHPSPQFSFLLHALHSA
jgi:hypothetical protein